MTTSPFAKNIKKHPLGVGAFLAGIVLSGAIFFRSSTLSEMEGILEQRISDGQKLQANVTNSSQMQEQYDELARINGVIASRAVRLGDLASNAQYFYRLESEASVKIRDLRPLSLDSSRGAAPAGSGKAAAIPTTYSRVGYGLVVTGTYSQLLKFLYSLEAGTHFSRLPSASISLEQKEAGTDAAGPASPLLILDLTVELFGQA